VCERDGGLCLDSALPIVLDCRLEVEPSLREVVCAEDVTDLALECEEVAAAVVTADVVGLEVVEGTRVAIGGAAFLVALA